MPNHYHLLVQIPQANLSQALQWLNVSYSVWFNRKHRRVGPLFQGRFKAVLVATDGHHREVSRYIHLNPIRTQRFGLGKEESLSHRASDSRLLEKQRVEFLRSYALSSYPIYIGTHPRLAWLTTQTLMGDFEGITEGQRRRAYRRYVEEPIRTGTLDSILDQVLERVVQGSREFELKCSSWPRASRLTGKLFRSERLVWTGPHCNKPSPNSRANPGRCSLSGAAMTVAIWRYSWLDVRAVTP
jgi:Transposase IS200 like